jgi:hypothetical protein
MICPVCKLVKNSRTHKFYCWMGGPYEDVRQPEHDVETVEKPAQPLHPSTPTEATNSVDDLLQRQREELLDNIRWFRRAEQTGYTPRSKTVYH